MRKKQQIDKLDRTVKELEETPFVEEEIPVPIVDKQVAQIKINTPDLAGYPNWSPVKKEVQETIEQVGIRDTYLPFVLTKLKIATDNTDARKMINGGRVKINNGVVPPNQGQITKQLSNFLLEVDGKKWEIFKID